MPDGCDVRNFSYKEDQADRAEAQNNTQMYGRRPYGVGFLVIGQDVSGLWGVAELVIATLRAP